MLHADTQKSHLTLSQGHGHNNGIIILNVQERNDRSKGQKNSRKRKKIIKNIHTTVEHKVENSELFSGVILFLLKLE